MQLNQKKLNDISLILTEHVTLQVFSYLVRSYRMIVTFCSVVPALSIFIARYVVPPNYTKFQKRQAISSKKVKNEKILFSLLI